MDYQAGDAIQSLFQTKHLDFYFPFQHYGIVEKLPMFVSAVDGGARNDFPFLSTWRSRRCYLTEAGAACRRGCRKSSSFPGIRSGNISAERLLRWSAVLPPYNVKFMLQGWRFPSGCTVLQSAPLVRDVRLPLFPYLIHGY